MSHGVKTQRKQGAQKRPSVTRGKIALIQIHHNFPNFHGKYFGALRFVIFMLEALKWLGGGKIRFVVSLSLGGCRGVVAVFERCGPSKNARWCFSGDILCKPWRPVNHLLSFLSFPRVDPSSPPSPPSEPCPLALPRFDPVKVGFSRHTYSLPSPQRPRKINS